MRVYYTTNTGLKKENNEDSLLVNETIISEASFNEVLEAEIDEKEFYLAIADGLGGYDFGEIAGRKILEFMLKYKVKDLKSATHMLKGVQDDLAELSFKHKEYRGMGSVLSGIKILENSVIVFNVGDSRTYRVNKGKVSFITEDDSLVYGFYLNGELSFDEMRTHPNSNIVTSCYRALDEKLMDFEVEEFSRVEGDRYFICSDGLWELVETNLLNEIIATENIKENLNKLLKLALKNGGKDNISFILIKI